MFKKGNGIITTLYSCDKQKHLGSHNTANCEVDGLRSTCMVRDCIHTCMNEADERATGVPIKVAVDCRRKRNGLIINGSIELL